jgi:hypothetical protein
VNFLDDPTVGLSGGEAVAEHGVDVNSLAAIALDILAQPFHAAA